MIRRWVIRSILLGLLLLCVGGWAWSGTHLCQVKFRSGGGWAACGTTWGIGYLAWGDGVLSRRLEYGFQRTYKARFWPMTDPNSYLGFGLGGSEREFEGKWVSIPYWFPCVVLAIVMYIIWRKTRSTINSKTAFPVEVRTQHLWRSLIRGFFLGLLLLCVGAWGWSYPFRERIGYTGGTGVQEWVCEIGGGGVFMGRHWGFTGEPGWHYQHLGRDLFASDLDGAGFSLLGFQFFSSPAPPAGIGSFAVIPFWFPTGLSALVLALVWWRTAKKKLGRAFPVEMAAKKP